MTNELKRDEQENYTVSIPKGSQINTPDEEGDFGEWIKNVTEFLQSPVFADKILPEFGLFLERKHVEALEMIKKSYKEMENKAKFNLQFLIARVIIGVVLVAAVTSLTVAGKIETETTIVTMMVTLGFIIWGVKE